MLSLHNALKKNGDLLSGFLDIMGEDSPDVAVERLGETLTPILDPYRNVEWATLRNECLFSDFTQNAAVVGELTMFGIGLPTTSQLIMVIDSLQVRGSGFAQMILTTRALVAATLAAAGGPKGRDFRSSFLDINRRVRGVEEWSGSDPAAFGGFQEEQAIAATNYISFTTLPYVISPGFVLLVQGNTVNTSLQVQFTGRVRPSLITER